MATRLTTRVVLILALLPVCCSGEDVGAILANRIDVGQKAIGIVVGTISADGSKVIGHGKISKEGKAVPDGNTVYEIGSVTKVFTSLILADMIERGEVKPDDPVAKFLPETVKMPTRGGRQITLLDLSQQISGLSRLPLNLMPADPANPYADYDAAKLYDFLGSFELQRDIGSKYEYSNVGVGLLGHALARKAELSYEDLVKKRILEPLGMTSTSITLTPELKARLAPGYGLSLEPVKNWDLDVLAGAGALRSTTNDLLKFMAAVMELTDTPLKPAMRRMLSVRHDTGTPDLEIAMGWHVYKKFGHDIVWHNGGTGGYRSFIGFDPVKKTGVVVLCNSFYGVDDIGFNILDSRYPVNILPPPKKAISVVPETLQKYVGNYQLSQNFSIEVTREGNRVFAQATGQPKLEIFAEKPTEFFSKVVDAQISFVVQAGEVTGLVLHQNGKDQKALKSR